MSKDHTDIWWRTAPLLTAGNIAYLAYAGHKGFMHVGVPMPLWYELRGDEREAWEAAALAAYSWRATGSVTYPTRDAEDS